MDLHYHMIHGRHPTLRALQKIINPRLRPPPLHVVRAWPPSVLQRPPEQTQPGLQEPIINHPRGIIIPFLALQGAVPFPFFDHGHLVVQLRAAYSGKAAASHYSMIQAAIVIASASAPVSRVAAVRVIIIPCCPFHLCHVITLWWSVHPSVRPASTLSPPVLLSCLHLL